MTQTLSETRIRQVILGALGRIAPEADLPALDPTVSFRDQLDIDSVDFLNFVIAVHDELGIDIPEADYGKLRDLDSCVAYLSAKQP